MSGWAELTLDALPVAVATLVPLRDDCGSVVDFEYVWVNQAACTYNALSREQTLGRRLLELLPGLSSAGLIDQYREVLDTGRTLLLTDIVYDNELRGGEPLRYDVRVARSADSLVVSWQDVTDRFLTHRELTQRASTDYLTHLTSRQEGTEVLRRELRDSPGRLSLAYIDVDGLKAVNDSLGHAAGDAVLVATAMRVRAALRADDVVFRYGGDEMVALLHGVNSPEDALAVCESVREAVLAP